MLISFTSLLERSVNKFSEKSSQIDEEVGLTEILDIVVEPRGKAEETSPAAVC